MFLSREDRMGDGGNHGKFVKQSTSFKLNVYVTLIKSV